MSPYQLIANGESTRRPFPEEGEHTSEDYEETQTYTHVEPVLSLLSTSSVNIFGLFV